jgi:hypothetical protein
MKTIFRFTGMTVLAVALLGMGAAAVSAQDNCGDADGQAALYTKFTELYPKTDLPSREAAIDSAKQFLEKYGTCEVVKEQADYFKSALPKLEETVKKIKEGQAMGALFKRFDAGIQGNNADEVYAAGKEILAKQPENINIILPMGLVGSYQSNAANNFKFADDGLKFANLAMSKINAGAEFKKPGGKAGAFQYEMTKPEAINELKYAIAYLSYYGKKDKATALPLYYELSQGAFKDDPRIYGTIGDYYVEQRKPIGEQIRTKIQEQQDPKTTEERKIALEEEIKKLAALFNGYNERILDALGRAHKVTKDTPANKAYRDNLYKIMQEVYKVRFPDKETGLNEYIAAAVQKPFPNPTSEVTPVSDPEPTTTTSATSSTAPAAQPATVTKPAPAATNGKTAVTTKPKQ